MTEDQGMLRVLEMARNVAPSAAPVLIEGASGTGKELLARFIHENSQRSKGKFLAINCAAVPEGLLESELFGYEKGAFTGAVHRKAGKFELAQGGTFLLDEINEFPLALQAKLLRVIQEGEVERLGGHTSLRLNVRIIASSNQPIKKLVEIGKFREDLYYRLNVIRLRLPRLQERTADIRLLAPFFVRVSCVVNNRREKSLSTGALEKLMAWNWPGNIRELENVIERAVLLSVGDEIMVQDIHIDQPVDDLSATSGNINPGMTILQAERKLILATLSYTENNRSQAARMLGISVKTLRTKIYEYGRESDV